MATAAKQTAGMLLNARTFWAALIFLGVGSCNSEVREETRPFSCCGSLRIKFEPKCEHTWSQHDMTFAHTNGDIEECVFPCEEIKDGWIVLVSCQSVNVTMTCKENNVPKETLINYIRSECQHSGMKPASQCFIGLQVLGTFLGQLLKWMMR